MVDPTPLEVFGMDVDDAIQSALAECDPDELELVLEKRAQEMRALWAEQDGMEVPR